MRDIELIHVPSLGPVPPAEPVDNAYVRASAAGVLSTTAATDPAFTDTNAYGRPSLGGDFGIGRAAILGADADGGAADLAVDTTIVVTPPVVPTVIVPWPGRSANASTRLNLFPWFKTPKEGLDMNNPNPPPVMADPSGITFTSNLVGNQGTAFFSGPALRNATIRLMYSINSGPMQTLDIHVFIGDTGTQLGARARAAIDAVFGLDAGGSGGTVNVVGLGGVLTAFDITVF